METTAMTSDWVITNEESIQVHAPGMWENETGPQGWYAISDDDGIKAYASTEEIAFQIATAANPNELGLKT